MVLSRLTQDAQQVLITPLLLLVTVLRTTSATISFATPGVVTGAKLVTCASQQALVSVSAVSTVTFTTLLSEELNELIFIL